MKTVLTPLWQRLLLSVEPEPNSGCWLWRGATIRSGSRRYYGVIGLGRRQHGIELVHRVAYRLAKGRIPAGMEVMHSCDNTRCVNPAHLSTGTRTDNMRDCWRKGRGFKPRPMLGVDNPRHRDYRGKTRCS